MPNKINLLGLTFGRLTVIKQAPHKGVRISWYCKCSCGKIKSVCSGSLKSGKTLSCGCLLLEIVKKVNMTHGMCYTPESRAWHHMKGRCYDKNDKNYNYYGGRGIKVCNKWLNSFENFFEDMGFRPTIKHSLDRINVNGDYKPSNCRWATTKEQSRNMRSNRWIEFRGVRMLKTDWADYFGILQSNLGTLLNKGRTMDFLYDFYLAKNGSLPVRKTKYNQIATKSKLCQTK